ncbi:MAG: polysaccharide deacetylase family protein [Gemmatimonadota bacterium]|nr:polysaccharide deacetylase family protein [Gemmatimonadota bacterium]
MFRASRLIAPLLLASVACHGSSRSATVNSVAQGEVAKTDPDHRAPNELGRIPILEYHLLGDSDSRWHVERNHFRRDLERLYASGYRPVTVSEMVDKKIDLPAGQSPVVFTFDDAGPSQFSYIDHNGTLEIDPNSAVGIWMAFHKEHPDWRNKATFCVLSGGAAGHSFFGEKGIEGQKSQWRFRKVRYLAEQGFELCGHTLWHANLGKYSDAVVQEQIARGTLAIDSAVPGYRVRTFALPLGVWPRNHALAVKGEWKDPRGGKTERYEFDAVLEVAGGPARSPYDPAFDAKKLTRIEVFANQLERMLDQLELSGARYVSDGDPNVIAHPIPPKVALGRAAR